MIHNSDEEYKKVDLKYKEDFFNTLPEVIKSAERAYAEVFLKAFEADTKR